MHILFLSWWWPYPASNGAKLRIYHLLRQLATTHQVSLLSFAEPDEAQPDQIAHLRTFCHRVEPVPRPQYRPGSARATLGYLSPWPRSLVDVYSPVMAERVREYVSNHGAQMLIASQLQTMRYLTLAPHLPRLLEEIEVTGFYDAVNNAGGRGARLRAELTLSKMQSSLARLAESGVVFTVVSAAEQAYILRSAPGARVTVIPNGVDSAALRPTDTAPQPGTLIYPGAVTYNANLDAVTYFIRQVLPLVRAHVPSVRFSVTGGTGDVDVRDLAAQKGVHFTGFLPSVHNAIRESWATVVPLRMGGGTRLKILESMALGTPVISTHKGAEGLDVTDGEHLLLADEPLELAAHIQTLFNDPALRARLSAAGRALVEDRYDWSVIGRGLLDCITAVTDNRINGKGLIHGQ